MNYQEITKYDIANGPGIRTVLWVSGCLHKCPGCHNPQTWDEKSGKPFSTDTMDELIVSLMPDYITGLTISGGDPLYPANRAPIAYLIYQIKRLYPTKSIWVYTGFKWEDLIKMNDAVVNDILERIDVLVDGRFEIDKRDISLPYCGSTNQRIIDVKKSLKRRRVYEYRIK